MGVSTPEILTTTWLKMEANTTAKYIHIQTGTGHVKPFDEGTKQITAEGHWTFWTHQLRHFIWFKCFF